MDPGYYFGQLMTSQKLAPKGSHGAVHRVVPEGWVRVLQPRHECPVMFRHYSQLQPLQRVITGHTWLYMTAITAITQPHSAFFLQRTSLEIIRFYLQATLETRIFPKFCLEISKLHQEKKTTDYLQDEHHEGVVEDIFLSANRVDRR